MDASGEGTATTSSNGAAATAVSPPEGAAVAESFKEQGNAKFRSGEYLKAAALYTQGLKADPTNSVLYSNRSAALLHLSKTTKALSDSDECIRLRPEWDKGYFRKAAALEVLDRTQEALQCYQQALERNKDNKQLQDKVRTLQKVVRSRAGQR